MAAGPPEKPSAYVETMETVESTSTTVRTRDAERRTVEDNFDGSNEDVNVDEGAAAYVTTTVPKGVESNPVKEHVDGFQLPASVGFIVLGALVLLIVGDAVRVSRGVK